MVMFLRIQPLTTRDTVHNEAGKAEAFDNAVHIVGPGAVDVLITPKAALETARRIGEAAVEAIILHATAEHRMGNK
jgi:hypothetical protein